MAEPLAYLRDGRAIYERSFAIIRAEADLSRFSAEEADIAVRMIHACGLVAAAEHIDRLPALVRRRREALAGFEAELLERRSRVLAARGG